ncbi:fungal-specific transcription factor domain-containing protein [Xylaria arbuscula]|nr:fungal-specific transcription factor domain-containing protein [Xylaria arbuscula]
MFRCWTCRSRKVKCDLGRPSCGRCIKARLDCQGYAVPLYWVTHEDDVSPSFIKRQAMSLPLGNPHWPLGTSKDIDQHIQDIDKFMHNTGTKARISGPLSVFQLEMAEDIERFPGHNVILREPAAGFSRLASSQASAERTDGGLPAEPTESCALVQKGLLNTLSYSKMAAPRVQWGWAGLGYDAGKEQFVNHLMNHYRQGVATILQPVKHYRNEYRSIYASKAMTMPELISGENHLSHTTSASRLALMYSLLASSGFHLRNLYKLRDLDHLAKDFRAKAYSLLRTVLESLSPVGSRALREAVLSVTLTLVTADILDGSMSEFWIHLEAANGLVEDLKRQNQSLSPSTAHLVNISVFLRILSDSTNPDIEPVPWSPVREESNVFLGDGHTLEYTYGITVTLANFIHQTHSMAKHVAWYKTMSDTQPKDFIDACNELYQAISGWRINDEPLTAFAESDDVTVLLANKHMQAFASSILIYFHTQVFPCDRTTMQLLVQTVALHLMDIEKIKKSTGYNTIQTASVAWPGFIASCQSATSDRAIWTEWWNAMSEYNIGNITNLWAVVRDTWALRDEGVQDEPMWATVLNRGGKRILAV